MVSGLPSQSLTGSNIGKLSYWLLVTGCWLLTLRSKRLIKYMGGRSIFRLDQFVG